MIKDLFKHSGIYFFGSLFSKVVTTAAWIALARILAPDKYGQFTLYFMILQIVTFIGDFGLTQYYFKNVDVKGTNQLYNKIIFIRTITLCITSTILCLLLFTFKIFDPYTSLILLLSLVPMAYLSVTEGYYLEQKKSFRVSLKLASIGGIFLSFYLFFYQNLDLPKTVFMLFVSLLITLFWFIPWKEIQLNTHLKISEINLILKSSSAYAYLTFTSFFYNRGDSFLISYFKGNSALGIYGLAYRFLESLSLFASSINQNLFPISAKKGGLSLKHVYKISFVMVLSGIIVSFLLYITSETLIFRFFGNQYSEAVSVLRIFSIVLLLFFVNAPLATVVQSSKLVKSFLPYGILNTLLNIILNIFFIPIYGIVAAAWIMLVTEISGLLINIYFIRKVYS